MLFLNEREIFKVLFDTKSFCIYCSKVSPITSIQTLNLFTIPSKNIFQCFVLIPCSILSFKSAVSLTFILMYLHRKTNQATLNFHLTMYELWKNGVARHLAEKSSYY